MEIAPDFSQEDNSDYLISLNPENLPEEVATDSELNTQKVIFTDPTESNTLQFALESVDGHSILRSRFDFWEAMEPEAAKLSNLISQKTHSY